MSGYHVAPSTLGQITNGLRQASQSVEQGASEPPMPQAGAVTGLIGSFLAQLSEAMGNVSSGAAGLADAVADGKDIYVSTDYDHAVDFAKQHKH